MTTIPTLNCLAVSGPRLIVPPVIVSGVMFAHAGSVVLTTRLGHVNGSTMLAPVAEGEMVGPLKIWLKVGTRKLVLYEPRSSTASNGRYLNDTLGFLVVPKPV